MEERNVSILLFYTPGGQSSSKDFGSSGNKVSSSGGKKIYGFVLQMHFDLLDVKNHFNMLNANERVGLDSKISTIRSVYKKSDGSKDDKKISQDISWKIRKDKGPPTPGNTLSSNCVCF
jgi:hypothetical protein